MKTPTPIKFVFLLVLLVAGGGSAKAQFPTGNASWHQYSFLHFQSDTTEYFLQGDTLLYAEQWKKMYARHPISEANYCGAVKVTGNIVEFNSPNDERRVLYDFNLSVGDTFPIQPLPNTYGFDSVLVVERIDSVLLFNGECRRVFISNTLTNGIFEVLQEQWIEGIGSMHGFLFPLTARLLTVETGDEAILICFSEEGDLLYQNPLYFSCTLGVDDELEQPLCTYPNPTNGKLTISLPESWEGGASQVSVYNANGQRVISQTAHTQIFEISLYDLPNGMYIMQIIGDNKRAISKKIIKR